MTGMLGFRRVVGPIKTIRYEGGESSRIYEGEYFVRARFTWPDGTPGELETTRSDYLQCQRWLLLAGEATHVEVVDPVTSDPHWVRVESAHIEPADG